MKPRKPIHLVICEGKDDQFVIEGLARDLGIQDELEFRHFAEEKGTLRSFLVAISKSPDFARGALRSILVTCDADDSFENRWQSVTDANNAAFGVNLAEPGKWQQVPSGPRLAAWINPGPNRPGMLETLCLEAVRENDPKVFPCIDTFMSCVEDAHGSLLHEKARFYIWSIVAQGPTAQHQLALPKALERFPPNWQSEAFSELREVLKSALE